MAITAIEPAIPVPGGKVTVRGAGFDPNPGRSIYWFGQYPAATWSVAADRTSVTVDVPAGAYSAPFTLQQPGGVLVTLDPFLKLKGTTLAGDGTEGFRDGPGATARFGNMAGIAADGAGNVYVSDFGSARIRKIAPDGTVSTHAGSGVRGYVDGPAATAQFDYPFGLAVDPGGNVWVVEETFADKPAIRRIAPDGTVSTIAGGGPSGFADGTGSAARFKNPIHLEVDGEGNLLLGDDQNFRIRRITPQGAVSTLAGSGTSGYQDGPAGSARFNRPYAAAWFGGKVFVVDSLNQLVRVVSDGQVSTLAGSGVADFGDGALRDAKFNWPVGMAVDKAGNLYVSDQGNKRIRVVTP